MGAVGPIITPELKFRRVSRHFQFLIHFNYLSLPGPFVMERDPDSDPDQDDDYQSQDVSGVGCTLHLLPVMSGSLKTWTW